MCNMYSLDQLTEQDKIDLGRTELSSSVRRIIFEKIRCRLKDLPENQEVISDISNTVVFIG